MLAWRRDRGARATPLILAILVSACAESAPPAADSDAMNPIAESYVKLVLAVGQHDADYVDAYYGPAEWRADAVANRRSLEEIRVEAERLITRLGAVIPGADEMVGLRHEYLVKQLSALVFRVRMLEGERFSFDEEAAALYDAQPPHFERDHFETLLAELGPLLPGSGTIPERYARFRDTFVIPQERVDTVFRAAIAEARRRTREHVTLPPEESFTLEYVTDKSWSGYNWYQGGAASLIQINTDLPITVDRAVDLAAHEGYPGHHVYNVLLEKNLVRDRNWVEYSVYPLFSPQSLIAEGSANYGIRVAFPGEERVTFEREVLYPLAGLDPARAATYAQVQDLAAQLSYAGNEAARGYLDGTMSSDDAIEYMTRFALMPLDRATQRLAFIDQYRSYVINYNYGQDMVRAWVERSGGTVDAPERRWEIFASLLSSPRLPSGIR